MQMFKEIVLKIFKFTVLLKFIIRLEKYITYKTIGSIIVLILDMCHKISKHTD